VDLTNLRRLARDVDDRHREAMGTFADDVLPAAAPGSTTRRDLLRTGAVLTMAGAAVTFGPLVGSAVAASAASTTTTTTTPLRPTDADVALLAFARSVELVAVAGYQVAIDSHHIGISDLVDVARLFQSHHREHAGALSAMMAGGAAPGQPNKALLDAFGPKFTAATDATTLFTLAFQVEMAAAATYLGFLGQLEATQPGTLVASILPIEAAHAVVLGQTLGLDVNAYVPSFESTAKAFNPSDYPLA